MTAPPTVFFVTDPRWPLDHVETVIESAASALARGSFAVQLRDKSASPVDLARSAVRLRDVTKRVGAPLVVNAPTFDALRLAGELGADGVHVPCRPDRIADARSLLGARAWVSSPAHSDEDVAIARDAGATGVFVSPIFESPGKGPPRGVAALSTARALAPDVVVIALGGVDVTRVDACRDAGAHSVAVIRALLDAPNPAATAQALAAAFGPR